MKVVEKGKRAIEFEQLKDAVRLIAAKRGSSVSEVQNLISESLGPVLQATQADYVKFHDDKSTYTGVYARGGPDNREQGDFYENMRPGMHSGGVADANRPGGAGFVDKTEERKERIAGSGAVHSDATEHDWRHVAQQF